MTGTGSFGRMELDVPDELVTETGCSPRELLFGLAVGLVLDGRLTLGRAAGLAGLSKIAFLEELGRRRLPMPYDERDLEADLLTLREVFPAGKPDRP
jgi:predicted HTH domain antitoxin